MPRARDVGSAIERRRGEVDRISDGAAQNTRVTGEIQLNGVGEHAISVAFPVTFVNKPDFTYGPELGPGQPATPGQFPTCLAVVIKWDERIRDNGSVVYTGASFSFVTTGTTGQVMIVQYHMEEVALRGPTDAE